ncbi:MAG: hypothetical protein AB7F19_01715 [Candidatus Babeliales bacterium]
MAKPLILLQKLQVKILAGKTCSFYTDFHTVTRYGAQLRPGSKLRTKHNLYTLDFRGQGESDKPAPSAPPAPDGTDTVYRPWQNYANDIHQAILRLGLTDLNKPVFVAHSAGAFFLNDYLRMNDPVWAAVTVPT